MVAKKKVNTYEPMEDELTRAGAYVQACVLLDHAAVQAIEGKNVAEMIAIADSWANLGNSMGGLEQEQEERELEAETSVLGFRSVEAREEMEDARDKSKF